MKEYLGRFSSDAASPLSADLVKQQHNYLPFPEEGQLIFGWLFSLDWDFRKVKLYRGKVILLSIAVANVMEYKTLKMFDRVSFVCYIQFDFILE